MKDKMCSTLSASTRAGVGTAVAILCAAIISNSPESAAEPLPTLAEMLKLKHSPWAKLCGKGNFPSAREVCVTSRSVWTEAGQLVVAVALIEREGEPKKAFRVATLPSALQVRYGTRIIIDKEAPYLLRQRLHV